MLPENGENGDVTLYPSVFIGVAIGIGVGFWKLRFKKGSDRNNLR
jgi:hypothetical protein